MLLLPMRSNSEWDYLKAHKKTMIDGNARLFDFTEKLDAACFLAMESEKMTKDLNQNIYKPFWAQQRTGSLAY